jgi:hypothetical protein
MAIGFIEKGRYPYVVTGLYFSILLCGNVKFDENNIYVWLTKLYPIYYINKIEINRTVYQLLELLFMHGL